MPDDGDDIDIAKIAREEAHRTVDNQIQTLNDIDSKAARILRINLLLLGVLLTGLSFATPANSSQTAPLAYGDLVNVYTITGTVFLLFSIAVAAITYTASSLQAGLSSDDLRTIINNDLSDRGNLEGIVDGYADWIEYNYKVNSKNAPLGTLTLLLLVFAMTALSLGVKKAVTGSVEFWLLDIAVLFAAGVVYLTGFIGQLRRWQRTRNL